MKKKLLFLITLLFSIIALASCDNENIVDDTPDTEEPSTPDDETPSTPQEPQYDLMFEGYYSPLNGDLDDSFKLKLHTLIEATHKNKGTYKEAWTILKEADEDPNNSSNIICCYTGRSIPKANQDKGTNGDNIWNREHVWPKSLGFNDNSMTAHNDCHHLHASEKNINATRGNLDFGEVDGGSSDSYGNKWNSSYFEPRDEVKGDIARSIFYMVIRYDGDDCDGCVLDLEIVDGKANTSEIVSGTKGRIGDLATLIKWHYEDPVDEFERNRNEIVYSYQGNRNPFIDHEEFISYLYPAASSLYI